MDNPKKITPKSEEEIREQVVEDYGFDPDNEDEKSKIETAVKKEIDRQNERIEENKKLSKAIEQKKKYRDKAQELASMKEDDEEDEDDDEEDKDKNDNTQNQQQIDTSQFVTKEEMYRQKYPNLTDEEYNSINALAKANGKTFEDTMENNPIAKNYLETSEVKQRVSGAIKAPSNRIKPGQTETEEDRIANEMDSDLPPGFSSKKE